MFCSNDIDTKVIIIYINLAFSSISCRFCKNSCWIWVGVEMGWGGDGLGIGLGICFGICFEMGGIPAPKSGSAPPLPIMIRSYGNISIGR